MDTCDHVKLVIVGHVDHGKSTLIGRLLHDTGSLAEGKLDQLRKAAAARGAPFEWANLMDALQAERDQNVTIDTAQIWLRSGGRTYVIIDAPGHKEFLKNMVTGAASADAALLLIDAAEGVQENSRRHAYLLHLLGIRQLVVLVNKMDLINFQQDRFRQIEAEYSLWLRNLGAEALAFVPVSAKEGDNVASRSERIPWWAGPTVLEAVAKFRVPKSEQARPLRFPIQDVYRFDDRRIYAGRIESGTLNVGDKIVFAPTDKMSVIKSIERWNAPAAASAAAGESVGITLCDQVFIGRGAVAVHESHPPLELSSLKARVFWLGRKPLQKGKSYKLKLTTQEIDCVLESVDRVVDASTLQQANNGHNGAVNRYEVGDVTLHTVKPVVFDLHEEIPALGRFVITDEFDVSGGGIVIEGNYPRRTHDSHHRSENIYWNQGKVTSAHRETRNGHAGCVIWLTGLSSAGKSTIAIELERELFRLGRHPYVLDGDNIRHGLGSDLGFSPEDRAENIRRIGEVAKLFADAGLICITAFISPYRADRDLVRRMLPSKRFIEVFVNAPIEVCEKRDLKGLYAKARANQIKEFTGISAPYEAPLAPELELRTDKQTISESVNSILDYLQQSFAGGR